MFDQDQFIVREILPIDEFPEGWRMWDTVIPFCPAWVSIDIVSDAPFTVQGRIDHVCLAVDKLEAFLEKCRNMGVEIARVPKGDAVITFIKDYDGNLFELKNV